MAIEYSTKIKLNGPWLLSTDSLQQLDKILNEEWTRLEARRKELIEKNIDDRIDMYAEQGLFKRPTKEGRQKLLKKYGIEPSYTLKSSERQIILFIKNGKITYKAKDFSSALKDKALINEEITGFSVNIESADIRIKISTGSEPSSLQIITMPESSPEASEAFVTICQWAQKNKPPVWQSILCKIASWQWIVWIAMVLCTLMYISFLSDRVTTGAEERAKELLNVGVTNQNYLQAIQLLLIIQTKYDPSASIFTIPSWFRIIFWGGLLISIVLSIKPKVVIGIGKGEEIISRWKIWLRLIGVTIPGFLILTYFAPWIINFFTNLVK